MLSRDLQTFLSEGHISYYTQLRGLDILRDVIVSGYLTFYQINTFLVKILFFHYWQYMALRNGWNSFAGRIWSAGCGLETPAEHLHRARTNT